MHMIIGLNGTLPNLGPQSTGTFVWSPAAGLSSTTSNPVAASPMNTTTYKVIRTTVPGGCKDSATITITVNKRPVVTTQPASVTRCVGNTATFTVAGTGTTLTYQWQERQTPAGAWVNLTNGAPYSGVTTATLTVNPVTQLMNGYAYRCVLSGICAPVGTANISNAAILSVNPNPNVAITPPVSCGGVAGISGTLLSVGSAPPPVPGSCVTTSGAISIAVPDNTANGIQATLAVSCVPANATVTGIRVNFNMPGHTYVGDMIFNLKAPNGTVLNLAKYMSGTATQAGTYPNSGYVNTTISSSGTASLGTATTTPITGTWKADLINGTIPFTVQDPAGFPSTATAWSQLFTTPNGTWTLAMADGGPGDTGTLTNWSVTIEYTTPGGGGGPVLSYVWSPLAGLYNNATATNPYLGTNTPSVYAAPTALTVYTVRGTDVATGCFTDATALVNYTPPAPTVTPSSVTMCLGDPAVKLKSSSSSSTSAQFCSGTVSVIIPDNSAAGATSNLTVSGIPAGCNISAMSVTMNMNHTWAGDVAVALKAPNGQILNLDYYLSNTGGAGVTTGFTNTKISSAGTAALSSGTSPFTGTFRADAVIAADAGPTGFTPTTSSWSALYGTPNGTYTLGLLDGAAGDQGTLTSWCIDVTYVCGVPATPAVWTPAAGLFSNAAGTTPYVAGTAVDSVWTMPTPSGVYNYQATVQSLPPALSNTNPANIVINAAGAATPYPSNLTVSGLPTSGVSVQSVVINGISHTWGNDVDIVLQSPTGQNVVLMSDIGGTVAIPNATYTFVDGSPAMNANAANPTGTYSPTNNGATDDWPAPGPGTITQATPTLASFGNTANVNGAWKLFVFDDVGGDAGSISGGYTINFNAAIPACTSPARTVVVTVNQPTTLNAALPVNQTICTDKVATFTVAVATGTGPHSYQWQVSTNSGNPVWTNIANGGVYSGATSATLTITAPPVSMSGYLYRCVVTGAAPCASVTSFSVVLNG